MSLFLKSTLCIVIATQCSLGADIFVDNTIGRDSYNGLIPTLGEAKAGPVRSLTRAAQLAQQGDMINLANTGIPYYDSLSLTGERHSGTPNFPFVVNGNGATLSGLRSIPSEGWQQQAKNLWKLTSTRKGYYQLLRDTELVPEFLISQPGDPLSSLPPGHWMSWRGSLYFRQDGHIPPTQQSFAFSADQTGISLHRVRNVVIANLKLQHFRFDGLHAQGLCRNIELDDVTSKENGRAGIVASGGSNIELFGGKVERNGRHQILAIDRSTAIQKLAEATK